MARAVNPPTENQREQRRRPSKGSSRRVFRKVTDNALPFVALALLGFILLTMYLWSGMIVVIKSGEAGALYRPFNGGTVTDYVYPEGLHFLKPWNRMIPYNTRIRTVLHKFDVLTNKGLTITLTLAIRYHPEREMVGLLHQKVGPNYVQTIVVPQVESVLRRNVGKHDPEDIYTNKEGILTDIIIKAIEEAGQKFVYIDDIIIRTVALPDEIRRAIKEKLVHQQRWYAYEFILAAEQQEAERKRIEAQGIRDYQSTIGETLTADLVLWQGIKATERFAESENAKIVIIGAGENGLPVILGGDAFPSGPTKAPEPPTEAETIDTEALQLPALPPFKGEDELTPVETSDTRPPTGQNPTNEAVGTQLDDEEQITPGATESSVRVTGQRQRTEPRSTARQPEPVQ